MNIFQRIADRLNAFRDLIMEMTDYCADQATAELRKLRR